MAAFHTIHSLLWGRSSPLYRHKPACLPPCMQTSENPVSSAGESTTSAVWSKWLSSMVQLPPSLISTFILHYRHSESSRSSMSLYPCVSVHFGWKNKTKQTFFPLISVSRISLFLERSCPSLKIQLKYYLRLRILKALWLNLPHRHLPTNIGVSTCQETENWEMETHFTYWLYSPNEAGILIILFSFLSNKTQGLVSYDSLDGYTLGHFLVVHYQPDVNVAS